MHKFKLAIIILLLSAALNAAEPVVPIGHLPTGGDISRQEVVWYYTLKYKTWIDGNSVKIVLLPDDSAEHADFVRNVLGISVTQYRRLLDFSINSGAGANLIRVKNMSEMVKVVESTQYTLGYMSKDYLILRGADRNVKILRIVD